MAVSLAADLFGHRGGRSLSRRAAIVWSLVWISVALLFGGWVALSLGRDSAEDFLTAWLIEKSLSIDNLFVFLVIFDRLRIAPSDQHRVLFWGIIGAFVTRAAFIASGAALLSAWHGAVYVLGAFLIYTGWKTARDHGERRRGREGPLLRRGAIFASPREPTGTASSSSKTAAASRRRCWPRSSSSRSPTSSSRSTRFRPCSRSPRSRSSSTAPTSSRSSGCARSTSCSPICSRGSKYLRYGLGGILVLAGAKMLASAYVQIPHVVSLLAIVLVLTASIVPSVVERRATPPGRGSRRTASGTRRKSSGLSVIDTIDAATSVCVASLRQSGGEPRERRSRGRRAARSPGSGDPPRTSAG